MLSSGDLVLVRLQSALNPLLAGGHSCQICYKNKQHFGKEIHFFSKKFAPTLEYQNKPNIKMNKKFHISRPNIDKQFCVNAIALVCFVLFIYASAAKLFNHEQFERQISQMPTFSGIAALVAWVIPGIELAVCGLLAFNMTRLIGLVLSFVLLAIFTLYILIILNFAEQLPYSDGSMMDSLGWKGNLALNLLFIGLSYLGMTLRINSNYYKY